MLKLVRQLLIFIIIVGFFTLLATGYFFRTPSLERPWSPDQSVLPSAVIDGDTITISNVRNFTYTDKDTYTPHYETRTYSLNELETVDYIVEQFGGVGAAHTFLSFGFKGGEYVAISAEIRKEIGEEFSPWKGMLRQYELMYVIADERDVIKLRTNYRNHPVFLYPVKASTTDMQALFVSMLMRTNTLAEAPEFYNTLTNTCTTNIAWHINEIAPGSIPFDIRLLMPRYSDLLAYKMGLLDTEVSESDLRASYAISEAAKKYANDPQFSERIRAARGE
jgi:Domain of unknown function (DUF4105)